MSTYGPPPGPPPQAQPPAPAAVPNDDDPFDPPPAYTPSAGAAPGLGAGETSLASGPSRMDFSGPPPLPERLEHNITGVGVGYGPPRGQGVTLQTTGISSHATGTGSGNGFRPPPPPQHPVHSYHSNHAAPSHPPPGKTDSLTSPSGTSTPGAGPSRPPPAQAQDTSPTEVPTPGRPLLHRGQLLVYPKGHWCPKCGNTGYKANDPSNPHETDWKKYGKPYNSALATSYMSSTNPFNNPSVTSSSNFQRPLPSFQPPPPAPQSPYRHLPPPPSQQGGWGAYPGQAHHSSYAPPRPHMGGGYGGAPGQGQQVFVQNTPGFAPPGALVVHPGDPRIGGVPCHRCGGSGRETDFFFGFDEGRCYACRGLGRLF